MDPTADTRGPQASRHSHLASFSVEHTFDIVNVSRMVVCPRLLLSSILCADKITARYRLRKSFNASFGLEKQF